MDVSGTFEAAGNTDVTPRLCLLRSGSIRDGSPSGGRFEFHQLPLSLAAMISLFVFNSVDIKTEPNG